MKVFAIGGGIYETDWVCALDEKSAREEMANITGEDEFLGTDLEAHELTEEEMKTTMITDLDDDERPQGQRSIWDIIHADPDRELPWHLAGTAY